LKNAGAAYEFFAASTEIAWSPLSSITSSPSGIALAPTPWAPLRTAMGIRFASAC
jgi:hypothetical protein